MKQSIKLILGGALLVALPLFLTSCDDILGQWDKPAPTSIVISQGTPTISITADDLKLYVDDTDTRIGTASTGATVNYASSDESIATVDANGKVTAVGVGTATITASVDPTDKFTGASATYKVIVSKIDVGLNPLYYVAETNVQDFNTTTKVVTFDSDPASLTEKRVYARDDAMGKFAKQTTEYDVYWDGHSNGKTVTDANNDFYYHLPCPKEWNSVMPDANDNIFKENISSPAITCIFGYDDDTKNGITDNSYWNSNPTKSDVRYVLRFLGTVHCSVWKYQSIIVDPTKHQCVLIVTAKIIDKLEVGDASLESKLAEYIAKDEDWWNNNNPNAGAVQRKFYSQGYWNNSSSSSGYANTQPYNGYYFSTMDAHRGYSHESHLFHINGNEAPWAMYSPVTNFNSAKYNHFSVRLFREPKE